jgi:hypothetical protein
MLHRNEVQVGDKVFDMHFGWSEVTIIHDREVYRIETNYSCYTTDGKYCITDKMPCLFWNEFEIPRKAFIKPSKWR